MLLFLFSFFYILWERGCGCTYVSVRQDITICNCPKPGDYFDTGSSNRQSLKEWSNMPSMRSYKNGYPRKAKGKNKLKFQYSFPLVQYKTMQRQHIVSGHSQRQSI